MLADVGLRRSDALASAETLRSPCFELLQDAQAQRLAHRAETRRDHLQSFRASLRAEVLGALLALAFITK